MRSRDGASGESALQLVARADRALTVAPTQVVVAREAACAAEREQHQQKRRHEASERPSSGSHSSAPTRAERSHVLRSRATSGAERVVSPMCSSGGSRSRSRRHSCDDRCTSRTSSSCTRAGSAKASSSHSHAARSETRSHTPRARAADTRSSSSHARRSLATATDGCGCPFAASALGDGLCSLPLPLLLRRSVRFGGQVSLRGKRLESAARADEQLLCLLLPLKKVALWASASAGPTASYRPSLAESSAGSTQMGTSFPSDVFTSNCTAAVAVEASSVGAQNRLPRCLPRATAAARACVWPACPL